MPDANITKRALANSMKARMQEKPFEKISVIDICEGCGMNRKSFYYHFKDKYDLVNWIFYTDFITTASSREYESGWDLLVLVADLFYQDPAFYREALRIEGQNSFRDYFYESISPIFELFLSDGKFNIQYICDAFLAIVTRWLAEGCSQNPDEFVLVIRNMLRTVEDNL